MSNCHVCDKRIWFWQKDMRRLTEPDEWGDRYGQHIHAKCE